MARFTLQSCDNPPLLSTGSYPSVYTLHIVRAVVDAGDLLGRPERAGEGADVGPRASGAFDFEELVGGGDEPSEAGLLALLRRRFPRAIW